MRKQTNKMSTEIINPTISKGLKILITGDTSAGKSTTANALGQSFNIPVFHTDLLMLKDAATFHPYDDFKNNIKEILKNNESYILDGCAFGEDLDFFTKISNHADIILNFDFTPKAALDGYFKRLDEYQKNGTPHVGMNMGADYGSPRQFMFFLKYYANFIAEKEKRKEVFSHMPNKVITIRKYTDADKLILNMKNKKFRKTETGINFLFDTNFV